MKKSLFIVALALGTLAFSSCASKKDLENCRTENNQLTADYQNAKETIAANNARIKSLEDQLAQARESAIQTISTFLNLLIRLTRVISISVTWLR